MTNFFDSSRSAITTTSFILRLIVLQLLVLQLFFSTKLMANTDRVQMWQQDIDHYAQQLQQNHMNLYHTVPKEEFVTNVQLLKAQLPTLSDNQVLVRLMGITRLIGDGHTSFPLWGPKRHQFPFKLKAIDERFYVYATTEKYKSLLGKELLSVNSNPVTDITAKLKSIVPFTENAYSNAVRVAQYMSFAEVLNGIGVVSADYLAKFTFRSENTSDTIKLSASTEQSLDVSLQLVHAISEDKVGFVRDDLWFSASPDKRSVYLKFRRYDTVEKMDAFGRKLAGFIDDNNTQNLIIDLRDNYGGDFFAGLRLAQYLVLPDRLNWRDGIFILIDNVTFSAAMSNAAQFSRLLNGKLVGQPTGAKPVGYQDLGEFKLPNSKWSVTYSKRYYDFLGVQQDAIYPDISIELGIEDLKQNKDPQLDWVLNKVKWQVQ